MFKQVAAGLIVLGLASACVYAWQDAAQAQTPYWDNSSGGTPSYYSPGGSTTGSGQPYSAPAPTYGTPQYNQPNYGPAAPYGNQAPTALHGYVSTAPVGTSLSVTTTMYLNSATARINDPFTATLGYDLSMGGNMILPAGSQLQGEVVSAIPAGRAGRHGQLQLRFSRAMLPDGRVVPLSARLVTQDGTGIIRGGTGAQRVGGVAKNTLGGAAIGAATGTALGAIVGGGNRWNEGMLWGSILGAGGGLARSGVQRGEEAEIQPGMPLQIMLDQPLTVTPAGVQSNPYGNSGYPY